MFNKKRLKAKIVKNNQLNVVHDSDLESLLKSLNVYNDVISSQKKCLFCETIITLENITSIIPYEGAIEFTCNNTKCQAKLVGLE
jgi:hypothetical protein